jgi:methionyl-tRNA formyltransferase
MRVVFAGTPEFGLAALHALRQAGSEVALVFTQPDRPAGRGLKLHPSAVKAYAIEHGIRVAQPRSLRLDGKFPDDAQQARTALLAARPDVLVVAAYGLLLPAWVLELPPLGCLNIHASLLPRWRGAAPIQRAIEAGDKATGITIMQMDAGLDTGAMLLAQALAIGADDSAATLHDRLAPLGGRLIVQALELAQSGALQSTPQPDAGISYAHKIDKAEAAIDWRESAGVIERRIRAFDPFPGASGVLNGETLKIWRAALDPGAGVAPGWGGAPGEIVSVEPTRLVVACGSGGLRLTELQRSGGKRMAAQAFLAGQTLRAGMRFAPRTS